jgi:hypothetical protein
MTTCEQPRPYVPALAADEAHAHLLKVEALGSDLDSLYNTADLPAQRAQAHAILGRHLKLAGVHAMLAVAEQLRGLREDLQPAPTVPTGATLRQHVDRDRTTMEAVIPLAQPARMWALCTKCGGYLYLCEGTYACDNPRHDLIRHEDLTAGTYTEEHTPSGALALVFLDVTP